MSVRSADIAKQPRGPAAVVVVFAGLFLAAFPGCGRPSGGDGDEAISDRTQAPLGPVPPPPARPGDADRPSRAERPDASVVGESRPLPASFDALRDEVMALVADLRRRHADAPETIDLEASMHDRYGNLAAATALWEEWLTTHPDSPEAHLRLGKYAKERGDDEAAIDHLRRAFEKRPELSGAQVLLGELLTAVGRADEAVAVLDRDLPSTAGNPNRLILLGHARLQAGDFSRAKADFIKALGLAPGSPHALYGLGTACARLGEEEEARRHLSAFAARKEETLARDRATADARLDDLPALGVAAAGWYATAGKIDAARGDLAAAERHWLRALDFAPWQRDAVTNLVERWRRQGRDADARAIVARARSKGGDN